MKNSASSKSSPSKSRQLTDNPLPATAAYSAATQAAQSRFSSLSAKCGNWEATNSTHERDSQQALYSLLEDCASAVDQAFAGTTEGTALKQAINDAYTTLGGKRLTNTRKSIVTATLHAVFPSARSKRGKGRERKTTYLITLMAAHKHKGALPVAEWIANEGGTDKIKRKYDPNGDIRKPRNPVDIDVYFGDNVLGIVEGSEAIAASQSKGSKYTVLIVENDFETGEINVLKVIDKEEVLNYFARHYGEKRPEAEIPMDNIRLKDVKAAHDADRRI